MDLINIEKFDPTVAELTAMVEATKDISATDLKDKKQIEIVKENRISLMKARTKITKIGKELREEAVAFQKAVIAKEKELIGIIEPEEDRLSKIEDDAKRIFTREARIALLPERREKLLNIGVTDFDVTDEQLIAMDNISFDSFCNEKVALIQRIEQEKIDADKRLIEEEKNKIARTKEIEEAKAKAVEDEKKRQAEQEELAKARAERAKQEEEARKIEEAKQLEKQKDFVKFRASHGYTEETKNDYKMEESATGYTLYKKLGEFKK